MKKKQEKVSIKGKLSKFSRAHLLIARFPKVPFKPLNIRKIKEDIFFL